MMKKGNSIEKIVKKTAKGGVKNMNSKIGEKLSCSAKRKLNAAVKKQGRRKKKAPEIAILLVNKVYRSTIDRWLRRYQQSGSFEAKPKSGRSKTVRTKRLINLVKKRLDSNNPRKSL